ncbi:MAG: Fe-S-containing protein [Bacillota bacterium]
MSRNDKRQQFSDVKKGNKGIYIIALSITLTLVLVIAGFAFLNKGGDQQEFYNVGQVNYQRKSIQMTDIKSTIENDKIIIPLKPIKENSIIYTEYVNGNKVVPLTAFITPQGDVIAAISMCEPCRGTKFHIEGLELVCNACGTRWTLDGLKGTWGGCLKYPPEELNYQMDSQGENLLLDEQDIANWQPRKV